MKTRRHLALENLALRQQLSVLLATAHRRPSLTDLDRTFWTLLRRRWSDWKRALVIVQPKTVVRWHRKGFRNYWHWKSRRGRAGRPRLHPEIRDLVRRMSLAYPLWGAPRIHGELLQLGIEVSQTTVAKYMSRHQRPPSQTWRAFLENHLRDLVSIDFFTVPSATFQILFVFVVLAHDRRRVLHFNVTEVLIAPRSPWQNPYVERLIDSVRRECLDHVIILGEAHLRRVLHAYFAYYQGSRTHLSLDKDAPHPRDVQPPAMGKVIELPEVGGLHHRYERRAA